MRELGYEFDINSLGAFAQIQVLDKSTSEWLSANGKNSTETAIKDKLEGNIGSKMLLPTSGKGSENGVNALSRVYGGKYNINTIAKQDANAVELQKLIKYAQENFKPNVAKIQENKAKAEGISTKNKLKVEWNKMLSTKTTGKFKNFDEYYESKTKGGGKTEASKLGLQ